MDFPTLVFLVMAILLFLLVFVVAGLVLSARAFSQLAELTKYLAVVTTRNRKRINRLERSNGEEHNKPPHFNS